MVRNILQLSGIIATCMAAALISQAQAQEPNLAGAYRCEPQPSSCRWHGEEPSILQSGTKIDLNISKVERTDAKLTSPIPVSAGPPFNAEGLNRPDHSIE